MMQATKRSIAFTEFELREQGNTLTFEGYASTFNQPYDMGWFSENVRSTAFNRTLKAAPDVSLLVDHAGLPLARTKSGTLKLGVDSRGLLTSSGLDARDPDVQQIRYKLERGDLDSMSFAFRVVQDEWSEDLTTRDLTEVSLNNGDVSIVTHPANPNASASLRSLRSAAQENPDTIRSLYQTLREERVGATISNATATKLRSVLESLETIDEENDAAQTAISELIGLTEQQNSAPQAKYDAATVRLLARIAARPRA